MAYLENTVSGIVAAGDIARWPDPHSVLKNISVELGVWRKRQGQTPAQ